MSSLQNIRKLSGVTIVELLVGMLLGIFLTGGVLAVYLTNKQTYVTTQSLSRIQENMRFSTDVIAKDVRMAGYMPCRFQDNQSNILTDNGNTWWQEIFEHAVFGYEGGVDTFPLGITPVAGSDALVVFRGGDFEAGVLNHNTANNSFQIRGAAPGSILSKGETAIVCDSNQATLFQVSSKIGNNLIFYSDTATDISPGNCTNNLGSANTVVCGDGGSGQFKTFGSDAQIVRYAPVIYFVEASSVNANVLALKREYFQAINTGGVEVATMVKEEILQGVETMQVSYGVDTNDDNVANQFIEADDVTSGDLWGDITSIKVGLLMASGEEIATVIDTNTYNVAGELIQATGPGLTHPQDKQQRFVMNSTFSLRNRQ